MKKIIEIARELQDSDSHHEELVWTQFTTGYDFGIDDAYKKIVEIYSDKKKYDLIKDYGEKNLSQLDKRRVEILEKKFHPYHLSPELVELDKRIQELSTKLSGILNTHRAKIDGKEVTAANITEILSMEPDSEIRKKAFLARAQVNFPLVDGGFIELLNLRKEYAKLYGASNFVEYSLQREELEVEIFDGWSEQVRSTIPEMEEERNQFAREYLSSEYLAPWDEIYLKGKIAPQLNKAVDMMGFYEPVKALFGRFGIDISKDNTTYDIFSRRNKSEWAYNFPIRNGVDSRILANVKGRFYEFDDLLHETGHSVHSFRLPPDDIVLNMGDSDIIAEGIANLFGSFSTERIFFEDFFKGEADEAEKAFNKNNQYKKINQLRSVALILFDQRLYINNINTIDDIHQLFWNTNKEVLDRDPYNDIPAWGFKIHHTSHPIYLHNYLMGDVTCEMLKKVFCRKNIVSSIMEKPEAFGSFLVEDVMKVSGAYTYSELFKKISGKKFSLDFLK